MSTTYQSRAAISLAARVLYIAVALALLICTALSVTAADEQVRFIVRRLGKDISSRCTVLVATEGGGMGGFFQGGPNGLYTKLPAGKYTAVVQDSAQQIEEMSVPATVEFEVTAGGQVVVEVEIMPLVLEGLLGSIGQLGFSDDDDVGDDDSDYGDFGNDGWGSNSIWGAPTPSKATSKQTAVDPWMADVGDPPDIWPYGPFDE